MSYTTRTGKTDFKNTVQHQSDNIKERLQKIKVLGVHNGIQDVQRLVLTMMC